MAESGLQFIRNVPPALKQRLAQEADQAGSNMNAVCVGVLSEAYGVEVEPDEARKTSPSPNGTDMMLRFASGELHTAIRVAAARHGWTAPREIVWALCRHFSIAVPEEPPVAAATA